MSSGAHLNRDVYDLIKAIGETRSKVIIFYKRTVNFYHNIYLN